MNFFLTNVINSPLTQVICMMLGFFYYCFSLVSFICVLLVHPNVTNVSLHHLPRAS